MRYQSARFSVGGGASKAYADNYDEVFGKKTKSSDCPNCDGRGQTADIECSSCDGTGRASYMNDKQLKLL
jgi:DnaJ-class molecular chaperone